MSIAKRIGHTLGALVAWPHLLHHRFCRWTIDHERAFIVASENVATVTGYVGVYARQAFYRRTLEHVGTDVFFGSMSFFSKTATTVGDRVYIGRFCCIGLATIEDDVMLADGVQILSGQHQHGRDAAPGLVLQDNQTQFDMVTIGRGAWLGAGAIVMADIGAGAIVGAGAVVTKPVDAGAKVAGVPARTLDGPVAAKAYT